jgi:hypothetical protein
MQPILIDDIEHTLAHCSPLGRSLIEPIIAPVLKELLEEVSNRNWHVVSYSTFVDWVHQFSFNGQSWLVLDKIFPLASLPGRVISIDLHRAWLASRRDMLSAQVTPKIRDQLGNVEQGAQIAVLDDAVYSGSTMRTLFQEVTQMGGVVRRVVLCVSRSAFIDDYQTLGVSVDWLHRVAFGQDILHARDFFPWLPHSGRRIHERSALVCSNGHLLDFRLAPGKFQQGDWLHLNGDIKIKRLLDGANRTFVAAMESHLGRLGRVADLSLLGNSVSIPLTEPSQFVDEHTPLSLLLS